MGNKILSPEIAEEYFWATHSDMSDKKYSELLKKNLERFKNNYNLEKKLKEDSK